MALEIYYWGAKQKIWVFFHTAREKEESASLGEGLASGASYALIVKNINIDAAWKFFNVIVLYLEYPCVG